MENVKEHSTMMTNGKYYCPRCQKLVKGYTVGGGDTVSVYYEVICEHCSTTLDED